LRPDSTSRSLAHHSAGRHRELYICHLQAG
jgi:hypothetical protein